MDDNTHAVSTLLIASVGGAPQPIVASIKHWEPARTIFIVSTDSRDCVTEDKEKPCILTSLKNNGIADFNGRFDCFPISDPQNYTELVSELRKLDIRIINFRKDHPEHKIVVDFTGGTKAMSAALALIASRWENCEISYVGGTSREKNGVGIVVDGKEQISHAQNPWQAFGYLVEEQARQLCNEGNFSAAKRLLEPARNAVQSPRKEELQAMISLCEFFEAWDTFRHGDALEKTSTIKKQWNNFTFDDDTKSHLLKWLKEQTPLLEKMLSDSDSEEKRTLLAIDIIANAYRRMKQGAYDDAVARFYRGTEAFAQAKLFKHGFTETNAVPLAQLPDSLKSEWSSRLPKERDYLKLGLQDDYALLAALGDDTGETFKKIGLGDPEKSPLVARNNSILAHGFQPVGHKTAKNLFKSVLNLIRKDENELLTFPEIT